MKLLIRNCILTVLFFMQSFSAFAQAGTGVIRGSVIDSTNKEVIFGAALLLEGTQKGGITDLYGNFLISGVTAGTYKLRVSYISYTTKTIQNITVKAGDTLNLGNIELGSLSLGVVDVVDIRNTSSVAAVLTEIKESETVVSGISAEVIQRGTSRNVAEVVKLIPGVTLSDNRFIMIRGLTPRYNTVLLNNVFAPSGEAEVRAFSFDILPANMVDRVLIFKTATPELPGDFAGGVVKVFTKSIPDKTAIKVSYSTSYRDNTTFKDFYNVKQGNRFWLSYDNGYHALPNEFPDFETLKNVLNNNNGSTQISDRQKYTDLLNNENWYPTLNQAPLDQRFGIDFLKRIAIGEKLLFGSTSSISYSNTKAFTPGERQLRRPGDYDGSGILFFRYADQNYEHNVRLSGLQNFALVIGTKHKFEFKNLYTHMANSSYLYANGADIDDDFYYKRSSLRNTFRGIYSGQLSGEHEIIKSLKANWVLGYASTNTDDPDFKNYYFQASGASSGQPPPPDLVYTAAFGVGSIISATSPARYFGKTFETTQTGGVDLDYQLEISALKWFKPKIKVGYLYELKQRESFTRLIGYTTSAAGSFGLNNISNDSLFLPGNFNLGENGFLISEGGFVAPNYSAINTYNAYYFSATIPIGEKVNLSGGIRVEHNVRELGTDPIEENNFPFVEDTLFKLPSCNLSYRFNDKHLIRLAYSQTVNRPEIREASTAFWYENITNPKIIISGNGNLKTATVKNYDFRYEFYPHPGETFSVGAFYKQFTNPIEQIFQNDGTLSPNGTFINTLGATSYGLELELVQSFRAWFKQPNFFSNFSVNLNAAYIRSEINVGDDSLIDQYNAERPLFGQAPYILNTGIYYQNDSIGLAVNIAYNITGPRIFRGGSAVGIPDIYEMPVNMIDLNIAKKINKYLECKLSIQNLLDSKFLFIQYYTEDRKVPNFKKEGDSVNIYNGFRTGRYYTITLSFKI